MLSYEIVVHCICGEIKKYTLNALRSQVAIVGRDENLPYQHIKLHPEDNTEGSFLSSTSLYFAFDVNDKDWIVGNGFPLEKYWKYDKKNIDTADRDAKHKRTNYIYMIENDDFHNILADAVNDRLIDNKNAIKKNYYENMFHRVEGERYFKLEKISGIGIMPISETPFMYNGKEHTGIKHAILQDLPFHWYIEIKNNRRDTIAIKSYIEKSKVLSKE